MDNFTEIEAELENVALNANASLDIGDEAPSKKTIRSWEALFGYAPSQTVIAIENHRASISRQRITDDHWDLVRSTVEPEGYDREAYEHELSRAKQTPKPHISEVSNAAPDTRRYLVQLKGTLTKKTIQSTSSTLIEITTGKADDGNAELCIVNATKKQALANTCARLEFNPTSIRLTEPAPKNFDRHSRYPTLGIDTLVSPVIPSYSRLL